MRRTPSYRYGLSSEASSLSTQIKRWDIEWEKEKQNKTFACQAIDGQAFAQGTESSLDAVFLEAGVLPDRKGVFWDAGSGTGTAIFHAVVKGSYEACIGTEIVPEYHAEANRRLSNFEHQWRGGQQTSFILGDLLKVELWEDEEMLTIFSFDGRMPMDTVLGLRDKIAKYEGPDVMWVTCFAPRVLNLPEEFEHRALKHPLLIGEVGITSKTPGVLYSRADQVENYSQQEWETLEQAENARAMHNVKLAMKSDTQLPQLEEWYLHVYHRTREPQSKRSKRRN